MIFAEHLCILIYAQDQWKEKDFKKLGSKTFSEFLGTTMHGDCEVCLTCPVCRADWDLFDPENPGEFVQLCDYCTAFLPLFKQQQSADSILLFSHRRMELDAMRSFVENTLANQKVKKVFLLQLQEYARKPPKVPVLLEQTKHQELKKSAFFALLESAKFEYNVLYEIFKDRYY